MSSSWGNVINLTDRPKDMFGKVMSVPDGLIMKYFTLATRAPLADLKGVEFQLKSGANPRDVKAKLAREIVKLYHNEKEALVAEEAFNRQFKDKEVPDDVREVRLSSARLDIVDLLVETKLVSSKTEARRMVEQGGVKIDGKKITSLGEVEVKSGSVVQVGKRKFVRITI